MNSFEDLPAEERIIVALDCETGAALDIAEELEGRVRWLKVGMTLFYANGPAIVHAFKERGFKVFLDLKFHDIPHQVEGAAYAATLNGADMTTMHTVGGGAMMCAAKRGVERAARESGLREPVTLGITVLTSMGEQDLKAIGVKNGVPEQVSTLALQAQQAGLSGVVASPQEAAMLREMLGDQAYIVTPGVRPLGAEKGDQSRVATPLSALQAGASHIVMGRPITNAASPLHAFEDIVASLHDVKG